MAVSQKSTPVFWWICIFILPIVWILRFMVSIIFRLITLTTGDVWTSLQVWSELVQQDPFINVVKAWINWILWIIALIGIPLTIVGVIMVAKKSSWLVWDSLRFGWKAAGKTVWIRIAFLVLYFLLVFGLWFGWMSLLQTTTPWTFVSSYVQPEPQTETTVLVDDGVYYPESAAIAQQIIPWQELPYYGIQILTQLLWILFAIAIVSAGLKIVYGDWTLNFSDFFSRMRFGVLRRYILWMILYVIAMMIGLLLFIIPWIIVAVRCRYFMHAIVKDTMWPIDALKHSREITRGHFWEIFGLQCMQWLIQIPGGLALGIGLFWTIPTAYIADVKAYQILRGDSEPMVDKEVERHTMSLEEAEAIIAE